MTEDPGKIGFGAVASATVTPAAAAPEADNAESGDE